MYGNGRRHFHRTNHDQFLGNVIGAVTGGELEVPLTEIQELELASELLEVTNEAELEQFLGDIFHTVGNAVGQFVKSDTGRALGGILKDAAVKALPTVGQAIGQHFGGSTGADIGGKLSQAAGSLLGLELEGLTGQEQELESARQFVRFAGAATNQVLNAPPALSPETVAQAAATAAAHRFAPGIAHEIGVARPYRPWGPHRRVAAPRQTARFASRYRSPYAGPRPRISSTGYRSFARPGLRRYGPGYGYGRGNRPRGWGPAYGPTAGGRPQPPRYGYAQSWRRHDRRYADSPGEPWAAYGPQWPATQGTPPLGPPDSDVAKLPSDWGVSGAGVPPWLVQLLHALQSIGFDPAALAGGPNGAGAGPVAPVPPPPGAVSAPAPFAPPPDPQAGSMGLGTPPAPGSPGPAPALAAPPATNGTGPTAPSGP